MKNIIVREYLESLTESEELDYIFPILLEVMGFKIISTPRITKGLPQYGKDVVAIGTDIDGVRKRFYFEVKGGGDKNITTTTYSKKDGVRESIIEAKDRSFKDASNPDFEFLPIKIILVHNGMIRANVKETFDGFIEREFPATARPAKKRWWQHHKKLTVPSFEFERWDIYQLTELFTEHLFNEYLLTDAGAVNHFKKVLVLINTPRNDYSDFSQLINFIFDKAGSNTGMNDRKRLLFFETLKMVSFIIYHYSVDARNLDAARKCIPYTTLKLWSWVLENKLENDQRILNHFQKNFQILYQVLKEYFEKTLPFTKRKDGLWASNGGPYEQVGYPARAMNYIAHLILYYKCQQQIDTSQPGLIEQQINDLIAILNNNDGTTRPFFDNHSIPICLVMNFFIENNRGEDAKAYLRNVQASIQVAYHTHNRLPDGHNRMESVIRFVVRKQKSVYYEDSTSHLFGIMLEYMAMLGMEEEYRSFREFLIPLNINLAIFIPYDDQQLKQYLPDNNLTHEQNIFAHTLYQEGYQAEIVLESDFATFQAKTFAKPVFAYTYLTTQAGLSYLQVLAHVYFQTPLFPSTWRSVRITNQ